MRSALLSFLCLCAAANGASVVTREEVIAALGVILNDPRAVGSARYQEAVKIARPIFESELQKIHVSDEAVAWVPDAGPCGGPGSPLLIAFFASVVRDHIQVHHNGAIYRGWLSAIRHYRFLRVNFPADYPPIASMEAMIEKDTTGKLREEGAFLERKAKEPNHVPEPAPPAVGQPTRQPARGP